MFSEFLAWVDNEKKEVRMIRDHCDVVECNIKIPFTWTALRCHEEERPATRVISCHLYNLGQAWVATWAYTQKNLAIYATKNNNTI